MISIEVNGACVIPVHLNIFFRTQKVMDRSISVGHLDKELIADIIEFASDYKGTFIYLDFERIVSLDHRIFLKLAELEQNQFENKNLVFANIITEEIEKVIDEEVINNKNWKIGRIRSRNITESEMYKETINKINNEYLSNMVKSIIRPREGCGYYLSSSNIYLNKYCYVKEVMKNSSDFKILLYAIMIKLLNVYSVPIQKDKDINLDVDYLVVSSHCGAAIASCISAYLKIPMLYFHNLGPKFALNNYEIQESIIKGKKYLYIYDVICLGTEYRLAKNLIESNGAIFKGGIGVTSYSEPFASVPYKEDGNMIVKKEHIMNIQSLVYIKELKVDYKIFTSYDECKNFFEGRVQQ